MSKYWKVSVVLGLIVLMVALTGCGGKPTVSSTSSGDHNEVAATDSGALKPFDMAKLSDLETAAKAEGKLLWYAAMNSKDMGTLAAKFMEKYPEIKVETLGLGMDELPSRIATEIKGGLHNVDLISGSGWPMDQVNRQGALLPFVLPDEITSQLPEGSYNKDGFWASQYVLTFPLSYNSQKLKAEGLAVPTSLEDLTKPEWKGKFAMNPIDYEWYAALKGSLGETKAKSLMEGLAANKPILREGSTLTSELLSSGEFAAAVSVYGFRAEILKQSGKPIEYVNMEPVITLLQPAGVAKNAPHSNAAKLFQLWTFSKETQQFITDKFKRSSGRKDVNNDPKIWDPSKIKYYLNDPSTGKDYVKYRGEYQNYLGIGK
jgi:iron(III) transport system substrate-binding protein